MRSGKNRKINGKLILSFYFLLLVFLIACGRRGDPVAIVPYEEKAVEKGLSTEKERDSDRTVRQEDKSEENEIQFTIPDSPTGLVALYTQKGIVLAWDEIIGQGVISYKIYRSEGNNYLLIGDTVTPAFTDGDVEQNTRYFYRVTAFGTLESLPSEEIEILTEVR